MSSIRHGTYHGTVSKSTNLRHGHGIMYFDDGSTYEGDYKDGIMHGSGRLMIKQSGMIYEG